MWQFTCARQPDPEVYRGPGQRADGPDQARADGGYPREDRGADREARVQTGEAGDTMKKNLKYKT